MRVALVVLTVVAIATVYTTNRLLTDRFTETTRNRAELSLTLNSGNLLSELRQNAIVPQLLSRDPTLIGALNSEDYQQSTQRLLSFVEEIDSASLTLLDKDGRVVAATDRNSLGSHHKDAAYFINALRAAETIFTVDPKESTGYSFFHSRRIQAGGDTLGVIVSEVDLQKFERQWAGISAAVLVADSEGTIVLSTEPRWRGRTEKDALANQPPRSAIERAIRATADWAALPADAYLQGEGVMRQESLVGFRGWRIASFTTYASVRERVNGVLALEIMGFALLLALAFYALNRRSALRRYGIPEEVANFTLSVVLPAAS